VFGGVAGPGGKVMINVGLFVFFFYHQMISLLDQN
jgi:hypothetical protein